MGAKTQCLFEVTFCFGGIPEFDENLAEAVVRFVLARVEPDCFRPERFGPKERGEIPKGAYIPFGGGSRTCIGMRFGQLEVRTIATLILSRFELELSEGFALSIRQMPTISPREGLPMIVYERSSVLAAAA